LILSLEEGAPSLRSCSLNILFNVLTEVVFLPKNCSTKVVVSCVYPGEIEQSVAIMI